MQTLAEVDPYELRRTAIAGPERRGRCFADLVAALADGHIDLGPGADWDRARQGLLSIAGIGSWSAEMIAMRALGDPDALPATDAGVRRGAAAMGLPSTANALAGVARRWSPWRSYAVQHMWAAGGGPSTEWPPASPRGAGPGDDGPTHSFESSRK